MEPVTLIAAILASGAICGWIGHYVGKNPGAEQAAVAAARTEWAKVTAVLQEGLTSAHAAIATLVRNGAGAASAASAAASAPSAGSVAAAAATGVSPAATPAWTLGASYASLSALLSDAAARTDRMIRLNDAPIAGFTLPNPVDFWLWPDGSVAQTKPA